MARPWLGSMVVTHSCLAGGFEECVAVLSAGIPCEVIPGVTSAIAAPEAYLIPPVLRGVSSSVAIVTGTEDPRKVGHS